VTVLLVFVVIVIFLLCWLLLSPIIISIDTRVPTIKVNWLSIGSVALLMDQGKWLFKIHVLFYNTKKEFSSFIQKKQSAKKKSITNKSRKPKHQARIVRAIIRVIKTFSLTNWNLQIDTGDYALNGGLYTVYALPLVAGHVGINFCGNNFFTARIRNTPLRMLRAYLNIQFF
jgi:hypothetical protein